MHPYSEIWHFSRLRLAAVIEDLTPEQWEWRMHPTAHTISEIVTHIAGAEHFWAIRMGGVAREEQLENAVYDGFLKERPFPFAPSERTMPLALALLARTALEFAPVIENPTEAQLTMPLVSPIGDTIQGAEGLRRIAQHASYHTGQIWMIRMSPGFPA